MIDKQELLAGIKDIIDRLEWVERWAIELQRELIELQAAQRAQLARQASIEAIDAPLTPATMKIANAISSWFDAIAQTINGTSRMRPKVIMFGMLNAALPR